MSQAKKEKRDDSFERLVYPVLRFSNSPEPDVLGQSIDQDHQDDQAQEINRDANPRSYIPEYLTSNFHGSQALNLLLLTAVRQLSRLFVRRAGKPLWLACQGVKPWLRASNFELYTLNPKLQLCSFTFLISSASSGTAANRSATMPKSATSKMGASGSLLMATMHFAVRMPARC